jgi:cation transport regulator ChaB
VFPFERLNRVLNQYKDDDDKKEDVNEEKKEGEEEGDIKEV